MWWLIGFIAVIGYILGVLYYITSVLIHLNEKIDRIEKSLKQKNFL